MPNIDEFLRQLEEDDKQDQRLITPVAYGKLREIAPQQIYYYIRQKQLGTETCDCGRRCIVLEEADALLQRKGRLPPEKGDKASGHRDEDVDRDRQAPEELER